MILRVINNKQTITKALREYGSEKGLEVSFLDSRNLTVDGIKGEPEIVYEEGRPYSQRKRPNYISNNRQLIIVNYLDGNADIKVLRAFCYMGFLGSNYDDIKPPKRQAAIWLSICFYSRRWVSPRNICFN